jgi:hypothetical protein
MTDEIESEGCTVEELMKSTEALFKAYEGREHCLDYYDFPDIKEDDLPEAEIKESLVDLKKRIREVEAKKRRAMFYIVKD